MKKLTVVSIFLIMVMFSVHGQDRAVIKNDTAYYKGVAYYPGKMIQIWYGSNVNKSWAYVYNGRPGWEQPLPSNYAKRQFPINKVYIKKEKAYIQMESRYLGMYQSITADLEGAVDFNEIK